jgi:hypothetical protein
MLAARYLGLAETAILPMISWKDEGGELLIGKIPV